MTEKSDQSEEQAIGKEKKDLPKFVSSTDRDKANISVSSNFENSITHMPTKEINSEFAQTFPLSRTPTRNEFIERFKCIISSQMSDMKGSILPTDCRGYG